MKVLPGMTFGGLVVLRKLPKRNGRVFWECQCGCGKIKAINVCNLQSGITKSCGCFQKKVATATLARRRENRVQHYSGPIGFGRFDVFYEMDDVLGKE